MSDRIRVLRVIARLNMGGPALHVAYLTDGLRERGYDTTLVAGTVGHGEQSMAYVAESLGVQVVTIPHLHREISPVQDLLATVRLARMMRADRADDPAHAHREGGRGRPRRGAARRARAAADRRAHVPRPRAARLLRPLPDRFFFRMLERMLAQVTDALDRRQPRGARRARRPRRRAGVEVRRHPPRDRAREPASPSARRRAPRRAG